MGTRKRTTRKKKKIDHDQQTFVPGTEPPGWDKEIHRLARKYLQKKAEAAAATLLRDDAHEACFEDLNRKGLLEYDCAGIRITRKEGKDTITIKGGIEKKTEKTEEPKADDAA